VTVQAVRAGIAQPWPFLLTPAESKAINLDVVGAAIDGGDVDAAVDLASSSTAFKRGAESAARRMLYGTRYDGTGPPSDDEMAGMVADAPEFDGDNAVEVDWSVEWELFPMTEARQRVQEEAAKAEAAMQEAVEAQAAVVNAAAAGKGHSVEPMAPQPPDGTWDRRSRTRAEEVEEREQGGMTRTLELDSDGGYSERGADGGGLWDSDSDSDADAGADSDGGGSNGAPPRRRPR
jgi:hypothetical protein